MGLDIYLYKYQDYNTTISKEKKYDDYSNQLWQEAGEYKLLTDDQKDEIRSKSKEFAISLGLNADGSCPNKEMIEFDAPDYPDHYFKIGYFRSSYNDGGINTILRNLDLPDLYQIFDRQDEDDYHFLPNWTLALTNVNDVISRFKEKKGYRVSKSYGLSSKITSEKEALEAFMKQVERDEKPEYNFSNSVGEFFLAEPAKVLALIPGRTMFPNKEVMYVITESDNSWYISALEIVKQTIEYVLGHENIGQFILHWSS